MRGEESLLYFFYAKAELSWKQNSTQWKEKLKAGRTCLAQVSEFRSPSLGFKLRYKNA